MPLYARLSEGRVIEVFEHPTNPRHLFDPSWTWLPCPAGTVGNATYDGTDWVNPPSAPPIEPPLPADVARAAKSAELTAACQAAILGGFLSAALGAPHRYPSLITDQINLMGSVTDSLLPNKPEDWQTPFWCRDEAGLWLMRPHDADQIQQAGRDGKAHVLACQQKLDGLIVDVQIAEDIEAIAAITW